jgi:hypothetical protein
MEISEVTTQRICWVNSIQSLAVPCTAPHPPPPHFLHNTLRTAFRGPEQVLQCVYFWQWMTYTAIQLQPDVWSGLHHTSRVYSYWTGPHNLQTDSQVYSHLIPSNVVESTWPPKLVSKDSLAPSSILLMSPGVVICSRSLLLVLMDSYLCARLMLWYIFLFLLHISLMFAIKLQMQLIARCWNGNLVQLDLPEWHRRKDCMYLPLSWKSNGYLMLILILPHSTDDAQKTECSNFICPSSIQTMLPPFSPSFPTTP